MSVTCRPTSWRSRDAGVLALVVGLGLAEGGDGLEREFGVDGERPAVRQEHDAVRPAPVRQRVLEFEACLRQPVLDDDFHAAWPNAPRACLLLSTLCSDVTCEARSVMFFCALSITTRRSLSFCRLSTVCWRVAVIEWLR